MTLSGTVHRLGPQLGVSGGGVKGDAETPRNQILGGAGARTAPCSITPPFANVDSVEATSSHSDEPVQAQAGPPVVINAYNPTTGAATSGSVVFYTIWGH